MKSPGPQLSVVPLRRSWTSLSRYPMAPEPAMFKTSHCRLLLLSVLPTSSCREWPHPEPSESFHGWLCSGESYLGDTRCVWGLKSLSSEPRCRLYSLERVPFSTKTPYSLAWSHTKLTSWQAWSLCILLDPVSASLPQSVPKS